MFTPFKFTPAWSKAKWVTEVSKHWPQTPVSHFKQMKIKQLIAIWHNIKT